MNFKVGDTVTVRSRFSEWNGPATVTAIYSGSAHVLPHKGPKAGIVGSFTKNELSRIPGVTVTRTSRFVVAIDGHTHDLDEQQAYELLRALDKVL